MGDVGLSFAEDFGEIVAIAISPGDALFGP